MRGKFCNLQNRLNALAYDVGNLALRLWFTAPIN